MQTQNAPLATLPADAQVDAAARATNAGRRASAADHGDDAVSDMQRRYSPAYFDDTAGGLVPYHKNGLALRRIAAVEQCQLTVRSADAHLFHSKQHLIGARNGRSVDLPLKQQAPLEIQSDGAHLGGNLRE